MTMRSEEAVVGSVDRRAGQPGRQFVFVVKDGRAAVQQVKVGRIVDGDRCHRNRPQGR